METQWSKLFGFTAVFIVIILICVVFGGYSSLYRSEGRIESSKEFLINTCRERLDLMTRLSAMLKSGKNNEFITRFQSVKETAESVIADDALLKSPLDKETTLNLEVSQYDLTKELNSFFLNQGKDKEFKPIKKEFFTVQDKLSSAKARYNMEVNYFETRTKIFPGFIIAKIFGFDKSKYYELSEDSFLKAERVFL